MNLFNARVRPLEIAGAENMPSSLLIAHTHYSGSIFSWCLSGRAIKSAARLCVLPICCLHTFTIYSSK